MADEIKDRNGGRWVPGQSGNPSGRPAGSRNRRTLLLEEILEAELEAITRKLIADAKAGDLQAIRIIYDRTVPRARHFVELDYEPSRLRTAADVQNASEGVLAGIMESRISLEDGEALVRILAHHKTIVALAEIEHDLNRLKERLNDD